MRIKNKFLRLISTVCLTLVIYAAVAWALAQGNINEIVQMMFVLAFVFIFIFIPFIIFIACTTYYLLTPKINRSERFLAVIN